MAVIAIFIMALLGSWFIASKAKKAFGLKRTWPLIVTPAVIIIGWLINMLVHFYAKDSLTLAVIHNLAGWFSMFSFYLLVYVALLSAMGLVFKKITDKFALISGSIFALLLVGVGFYNAQFIKVTEYEIPVRGLEQPVVIMNIPDVHLGGQRGISHLEKLLARAQKYNPDIIVYNGDLIDSNIALQEDIFALFKNVKAEQYFTTGNHEFYMDTERAIKLLESSGIMPLRNKMVETHGLQLIGLEYMSGDKNSFDPHRANDFTIEEELPKITRDMNKPVILLHHSPVGLQYVKEGNIAVMLTGHTHGGQIWPFTIVANIQFPLRPGAHKIEDTWFLVSQGAGTFGPWMRLGTSNEMQVVRLMPLQEEDNS